MSTNVANPADSFLCHIAITHSLDPPLTSITLEEELGGQGWNKVLIHPIVIISWSLITPEEGLAGWGWSMVLLYHIAVASWPLMMSWKSLGLL